MGPKVNAIGRDGFVRTASLVPSLSPLETTTHSCKLHLYLTLFEIVPDFNVLRRFWWANFGLFALVIVASAPRSRLFSGG